MRKLTVFNVASTTLSEPLPGATRSCWPAASLRLVGTKPTITGVIIATYRPAGSVQDKEEQP